MNIANVMARFAVLADLDSADAEKYQVFAENACDHVMSLCKIEEPDSAQTARLEMIAAAYLLKLYGMCDAPKLTSFAAGDVKLTSSVGGRSDSASLWEELCAANTDLIKSVESGFLFGRVMT